jgi:PAS domain S-box-containing protein
MQLSIAAVVNLGGLGIIGMILIMPLAEIHSYYVGLILVFIFGYTFFKLRFIWATLVGWLIVIAYEISAIWVSHFSIMVLINHNYFFLSSNIVCMFACYSIELSARKEFIQARLLESEKQKVETLNSRLETMVKDRTEQLVNANEDLIQEIVERKHAEEALKASEERYRTIIESIEEGYFEIDLVGNLMFCNDALCSMLSYPREELVGMNNLDVTSSETAEEMYKIFNEVYRTGVPVKTSDFEIFKKNGEKIIVEISASPISDSSGKRIGFRGAVRDVTERKRAETDLQKSKDAAEAANLAKSEFLSNMSHELRTPLNHIMGFTELVVTKCVGELNEIQEEYLHDALESSKHLLSLINDILDISKIEEGKIEIELSEVNVRSLMEQSVFMIREDAVKHRLTLSIDTDDMLPVIRADERKLRQVMYNLLSNAVKFTPDGGMLRMQARQVDLALLPKQKIGDCSVDDNGHQFIEFAVSDSGIGVKYEDQERIFNRFEQADGSLRRRFQGSGLGLALSKELVELHGGKIWVDSEGEGRGSTFRFVVPV